MRKRLRNAIPIFSFWFVWLLIDTLVDISSSWKRSDYHCLSVKRETVTLAPWFADLNTVPGHREGTVDSRLMHLLRMKSVTLRWLDTILHVALIHETFETLALAFYAVVELIVAPAMNNEYALCWELWRAGGLLIYSPSTFESLGSVLLTQDSDSRCGASRWQKTAAWSKCWCLAVIIPH